ncbi:MAG: hypothetical protein EKK49_08760, partial [Rhodocyclaceae bacterium]
NRGHVGASRRTWLCRIGAITLAEPDEIRVAYALHGKRPQPRPKVNQVLRLIAMPGGFIGRKGDGGPGVKSIGIGLQKVRTVIQAPPLIEAGKAGKDVWNAMY